VVAKGLVPSGVATLVPTNMYFIAFYGYFLETIEEKNEEESARAPVSLRAGG